MASSPSSSGSLSDLDADDIDLFNALSSNREEHGSLSVVCCEERGTIALSRSLVESSSDHPPSSSGGRVLTIASGSFHPAVEQSTVAGISVERRRSLSPSSTSSPRKRQKSSVDMVAFETVLTKRKRGRPKKGSSLAFSSPTANALSPIPAVTTASTSTLLDPPPPKRVTRPRVAKERPLSIKAFLPPHRSGQANYLRSHPQFTLGINGLDIPTYKSSTRSVSPSASSDSSISTNAEASSLKSAASSRRRDFSSIPAPLLPQDFLERQQRLSASTTFTPGARNLLRQERNKVGLKAGMEGWDLTNDGRQRICGGRKKTVNSSVKGKEKEVDKERLLLGAEIGDGEFGFDLSFLPSIPSELSASTSSLATPIPSSAYPPEFNFNFDVNVVQQGLTPSFTYPTTTPSSTSNIVQHSEESDYEAIFGIGMNNTKVDVPGLYIPEAIPAPSLQNSTLNSNIDKQDQYNSLPHDVLQLLESISPKSSLDANPHIDLSETTTCTASAIQRALTPALSFYATPAPTESEYSTPGPETPVTMADDSEWLVELDKDSSSPHSRTGTDDEVDEWTEEGLVRAEEAFDGFFEMRRGVNNGTD